MALDFHRMDTKEHLFGLEERELNELKPIFDLFYKQSNIRISNFNDAEISISNQKFLIKIIEGYIKKTDLNINKYGTSLILEFKGLLKYFSSKKIEWQSYCD